MDVGYMLLFELLAGARRLWLHARLCRNVSRGN